MINLNDFTYLYIKKTSNSNTQSVQLMGSIAKTYLCRLLRISFKVKSPVIKLKDDHIPEGNIMHF